MNFFVEDVSYLSKTLKSFDSNDSQSNDAFPANLKFITKSCNSSEVVFAENGGVAQNVSLSPVTKGLFRFFSPLPFQIEGLGI